MGLPAGSCCAPKDWRTREAKRRKGKMIAKFHGQLDLTLLVAEGIRLGKSCNSRHVHNTSSAP
eukprot:164577-Amphidinium_carterae.1